MTEKRFTITQDFEEHHRQIRDNGHIIMGCFVEPQAEPIVKLLNELNDENEQLKSRVDYLERKIQRERASAMKQHEKWEKEIKDENEQLKAQLYCDDEEGVCNICKHHYLVKDDEAELGYYTSRCKK